MSLYEVSVAVHVAAALVGFGPTFAYPVLQLAAGRATTGSSSPATSRSAAMAAVVIAYEPISVWLVAGSAAGELVLIGALVRRRLR